MSAQKTSPASATVWQVVFRVLFTLVLLGTVVFIFANSRQIGSVSSGRSQQATALLNNLLARLGSGRVLSEYTVRKLGHFAEFMLLGFWFTLTLRVYTRRVLAFIAWPLLGGLIIAVLDEFSQLYVQGRTSQVTDVMIDFAGVIVGILFGLVLILIASSLQNLFRRRRQDAYE